MDIKKYGFHPSSNHNTAGGIPARITSVHHDLFAYVSDAGGGYARLKASRYHTGNEVFPTTGDFVMLERQPHGEGRILQTLPRHSFFSRTNPSASGHGEQAVAANFDYVFIMQALDRDFNPRRLERYLTQAWQSGATPVVLLTKSDCVANHTNQLLMAERTAIGADVFAISAMTGHGMHQLRTYMKPGTTIVFLGSSGVGKSSLVNLLAGKEIMATKNIREKDGRGRHATTHRQLILLENGAMIIDTPGMRELGMWDVSAGLGKSFADVEQYFGQCKFSDCRHQNEPGCAVKAAIRHGELSAEHWESYLRLGAEARYVDDKTSYLRQKEQFFKEIAKSLKQQQKHDNFRHEACHDSFTCKVCGALVLPDNAGSKHRNHCPFCLSSVHVDNRPGDRASLCKGIMEPIGIWVRKDGEWAIIHRCKSCGALGTNRIAADDDQRLLMTLATKPLESQPFPLVK